ncbi:MAG: tRNA uridine-5-carboxymethylaminomethyl(34) synthesis GTPase MnmE [Acidisphaera sp.]|nr:tRNA uridine-5-carboxymethylaminomethyl(34) synthesis GTPase MnmE [Acidisphaera sp.]
MQAARAGDTIFAMASGAGRAAVSVLRLSGSAAGPTLDALCGRRPPPRHAGLRTLRADDGEVLDRALVLWFPGPGSYTGEDCGELHLHGGRAVVEGVSEALTHAGARPAEPGEFTRRAFLNGRMDLIEAEAVADLVEAETSAQRRQALRQLDGALGELYGGWAERLRRLMAQQEALIDFPDEDLPPEVEAGVLREIDDLRAAIGGHLQDDRRGERVRSGLVFAITGPPNVGKSSLVNALAGRDVAIVSPLPGTTRDAVEARMVLAGVPVTLVDTAGLRETGDAIEAEGVRRARARAREADLVLAVHDAAEPCQDREEAGGAVISVANKVDLVGDAAAFGDSVAVSARTGFGLDRLRSRLEGEARRLTERSGPAPLTRARHRAAMRDAVARLTGAAQARLPELRAEDLRLALRSIGRATGFVSVDDVLASIFSEFCIGK